MSWFGWAIGFDKIKEQVTELTLLGLTYAFLFAGSISLFFVGLFLSVGGLDYFLLIDKQSLLASLLIYTAVLSSITMVVTFVPRIIIRPRTVADAQEHPHRGWTNSFVNIAQGLGLMGFSIYIVGLDYTILLALPAGCILLWVRLRHGPLGKALKDPHLLKPVTSVLLLCCLAFGYLRAEHLREQPASMIIHLVDPKQPPVRVTVIMSFDQGVLVFAAPNAEPRLVPWDRIASIASVPSQGGIRQRLRDWRDAVRSWMGGSAAVVHGRLG